MLSKKYRTLSEEGETRETGITNTSQDKSGFRDDVGFKPSSMQDIIQPASVGFQKLFKNIQNKPNLPRDIKTIMDDLDLTSGGSSVSLANAFAKVLKDALTDKNGEPISLYDESGHYAFKNRLLSILGEDNSALYPLLVMLGLQGVNGETSGEVNKGAYMFIRAMGRYINDLDPKGNSVYKLLKQANADTVTKSAGGIDDPKSGRELSGWLTSYMNGWYQDLVRHAKVPKILGLSPDQMMNTLFPDVMKQRDDDNNGQYGKFYEMKKDMIDAIEKEINSGDAKPFMRGSESDTISNDMLEFVRKVNDPDLIIEIVKAIAQASHGNSINIPAEWISSVATDHGEEFKNKLVELLIKYNVIENTSEHGFTGNKRSEVADQYRTSTGSGGSSVTDEEVTDFLKEMATIKNGKLANNLMKKFFSGKTITKDQYAVIYDEFKDFQKNSGDSDSTHPYANNRNKPKMFNAPDMMSKLLGIAKLAESKSYDYATYLNSRLN